MPAPVFGLTCLLDDVESVCLLLLSGVQAMPDNADQLVD
jgi:hypothetical protein